MATASISPINGDVTYEGKLAQTYSITGSVSYTTTTHSDNSVTYYVSTVRCTYSGSSWSGGVETKCNSCCGTWGIRWWNGSNFKTWNFRIGSHFPVGSSSYSADRGLVFTLQPGESATYLMYTFFSAGCGSWSRSVTFRNTNSRPTPRPPVISPSCGANQNNATAATMSASISYGWCDSQRNSSSYAIYSDEAMTKLMTSGSGNGGMITGLAPNTRYWAVFNASNGCFDRSANCSVVTVTPNSLSEAVTTSFDRGQVRLVVTNGGGEYDPTTKVYIQPCAGGAAQEVATSTTKTVEIIKFQDLEPETCYNLWAVTTTPAGSYTGNTVQITTPRKGICIADFTSIEPQLDEETLEAFTDLCYQWETTKVPATIVVRYRVKDGFDTQWYESETITVDELTGTHCLTLHDLYPNQTVYEAYIHTETDEAQYDSPMREFATSVLPQVQMYNCENFFYMTELLCASINKIKHGNKTIYANPYSQAICDPYNEDPTMLTLWTRALRLFHAMYCVVSNIATLAASKEGQYYVGEVGWQDIQTIIDETDEENQWKIATSNAIYEYLTSKLKEVWHYQGTVDVLVQNVADLENYPTAKTAIVVAEGKIYNNTDGTWAEAAEQPIFENHGVWHINMESNTDAGHAVEGSAWYYWNGIFKPLDTDLADVTNLLSKLEAESNGGFRTLDGQEGMTIAVSASEDFDCDTYNDNTVIFVTEPVDLPTTPSYVLDFVTGVGAPDVPSQTIVSGGLPVKPADPVWQGHEFVKWKNMDGTEFDFDMPITENTVAVAEWNLLPQTISFNLNGGTGTTPENITVLWGEAATLPTSDAFSKEGYEFKGWADSEGKFYNDTTPITRDVTLYAQWSQNLIDVYFYPEVGGTPIIVKVGYGEGVGEAVPAGPPKEGFIFEGWYDNPAEGNKINPDAPVTISTNYYAHYVGNEVTVTFDSNGGSPIDSIVTTYGSTIEPPIPTKDGYVFEAWMWNDEEFNFATPITQNMTLLASWSQAFTVSFDLNGGDGVVNDQTVKSGGHATKPEDPTRDGCDFDGWKETDAVKVTFNTWNGMASTTTLIQRGGTVNEPPIPTKDGCLFDGWYIGNIDPNNPNMPPAPEGYHTVTINKRNNTTNEYVYVKDGETLPPIMNPKKENCRFTGWTTSEVETVDHGDYSEDVIKEGE